jgi:hypothetical protein
MTIVLGCWLVGIALLTPHASLGRRLVTFVAGGSAVAVIVRVKRPSKRRMPELVVLTWTVVVAAFAMFA